MAFLWKWIIAEEEFFEFNLKFLCISGLWPRAHWTKNQKLLYKIYEVVLHIISINYLVLTGIGTYQARNEIALFLSSLDKSLVAYNFVFKVALFVWKRNQLKFLISDMKCSGDHISEKRRRLMIHHVVFVSVICMSIMINFIAMAEYKFEMAVQAWMPFDPLKSRRNLFMANQILAVSFSPCMFRCLAMQGIVCSLIMYMCDQLIDLQGKLRKLKYSPENDLDLRAEFKEIVKKHVRIIGYAKTMEEVFKEYFLVQNLAITIELCLNAMVATMIGFNEIKLLAGFLAFLGLALLNAYIYCYLGNEMIIQSEGIALAAYETSCHTWPVDLRKDLLLVIRCAQKPIKLTAGGMAPMSLQTFGQALYNGYSIFAFLNDVVD